MKEILISSVDVTEFQSYIKKLLSIDKFIFIKVEADKIVSSVYLPQRDAVKFSSIDTSDIFTFEQVPAKPVKVSFFNGNKVIEALSNFSGQVKGKVLYQEMGDELIATDFVVHDDSLKINLFCADPSLSFMEMTTDERERAFSTSTSQFSFELLTTHISKIKSLFNLDKEKETFTIYANENGVNVKGENYDAVITQRVTINGDDPKVTVYKKYISLLDNENYDMVVCSNKVVFKSQDSGTILTIAVAIIDED
jgi:hypothetical protein